MTLTKFPLKLTVCLLLLLWNTTHSLSQAQAKGQPQTIEITSQSFNAKARSLVRIGDQQEYVKRGLTLIHLLDAMGNYEEKTFDTYAVPQVMEEVITLLRQMNDNGAYYILLAHDSAVAGERLPMTEALLTLHLNQLAELKGRQAYVLHNLNGSSVEQHNDLTVEITTNMPKGPYENTIYFPKKRYPFTPSVDRYIAHAGGEVNGLASTNSLDALNENYDKGFRLFELDIVETADGHFVAAHDWNMWARFTDYEGSLPPTLSEFKQQKIYGKYSTLDMKAINDWFSTHTDAQLITDKVNRPADFAAQFCDTARLKMELFSLLAIDEALAAGVTPILSQEPLLKLRGDKVQFLNINSITHVALSRRIIDTYEDLMLQLKENDIKVYVYNVNFDPGKDERYVQENELGLVYGMYADQWVFDSYLNGKE